MPKKDDSNKKVASDLANRAQAALANAWDYAGKLQKETLVYIFLIVGVLLFFISPVFGGAIVGAVVGVTFADQITAAIKVAKSYFQDEQLTRTVVFLSLLLLLVYALPTLFLGTISGVGVLALLKADLQKKRPK